MHLFSDKDKIEIDLSDYNQGTPNHDLSEDMIDDLPLQASNHLTGSNSLQSSQNTADFTKDIQKEQIDINQTGLSSFPNVNIDDINLSKADDLYSNHLEKQDTLGQLIQIPFPSKLSKFGSDSPDFKKGQSSHSDQDIANHFQAQTDFSYLKEALCISLDIIVKLSK